jgi:hypothetical protein
MVEGINQMALSESLAALFSGVHLLSLASDPSTSADYALFIDGQKKALILADPDGNRTWPEWKIVSMWQQADECHLVPLVCSKIHGKWYYMDLNWGSIPAMVPDFTTKLVEIWFKGYTPISELLAHIEKRRSDYVK